MKTAFILMAQYDGLAIIPVEMICKDYFRHLTVEKFFAESSGWRNRSTDRPNGR